MLVNQNKNSFESSMFYRMNMKINRSLPFIYSITLLVSMLIIFMGKY
ncbi:hypothetical protein [Halarcobacter anaerophilus]|jgi:hypothetical protein|nr:hypothetical protein [Halarcobacter anaerophilus]